MSHRDSLTDVVAGGLALASAAAFAIGQRTTDRRELPADQNVDGRGDTTDEIVLEQDDDEVYRA
ncbi:hypothetical protein [Natrinema longum]|uniref:Uncharacterized protein n=1 Tax=Natrinema longum TaxID=370324 RepID=A0A8A2UB70_9EURY|nr:hypothetical protein [Natrinema longum]MBZ6496007.1 hypothetical protein [Natrinema longum]QSW86061.1 hypothetical protein J0X27_04305 [Natrinema longum]